MRPSSNTPFSFSACVSLRIMLTASVVGRSGLLLVTVKSDEKLFVWFSEWSQFISMMLSFELPG